jgi:pentatricopeptide repeat protein
MAQMRRDGVPVTAVAYTTAIKGCVHALDMRAAWAHLEQLLAEAPPLTIRTVNTMLRGCLYVGDLEGTERLVQLAASHGLEPDQATRETVIRATCQAFDDPNPNPNPNPIRATCQAFDDLNPNPNPNPIRPTRQAFDDLNPNPKPNP